MFNIEEMIKHEFALLKENSEKDKDKTLNYKARVKVYKYLRFCVEHKTREMSYEEYSDYMRLESSILFTDLTYRARRSLRNGYDHLYNEFQPLFKTLTNEEIKDICNKCLAFSKDITKFEDLKCYLKYEPVKTYARFIANRYKPILAQYKKEDLASYCDEILDKSRKTSKGRV
jgi:hypothetical protein